MIKEVRIFQTGISILYIRSGENDMSKIMISQSIMWASAIIVNALDSDIGWLLLALLATMALGSLKTILKSQFNQSG